MSGTVITIVGNVVATPERRKTESGASVASFRIASTERRYDRHLGDWADGRTLFLKVNCWRQLADNVDRSVVKGDPVIVTGRLYTREYELNGQKRSSFEVEADAIGLNLGKGVSTFSRTRSSVPTYEVNDGLGPDDVPVDEDEELDPPAEPLGEGLDADAYEPSGSGQFAGV